MTTFQLKPGHTQAIAEVNEKQWIEGSKMHNSDEDSDDEKVKDVVDKLTEEWEAEHDQFNKEWVA